jgi:hypothetical protein
MRCAAVQLREPIIPNILCKDLEKESQKKEQGAKPCSKRKKEQGTKPCSKNCVDPISPQRLDLILIDGATLLVRARAPPETWTTRLQPLGQPEPALVDHLFRFVINFSSDCSKLEQSAKSLQFRHPRLHSSEAIRV